MKRYAIDELVKWKNSNRRKPLVIEGARQVGKTWLVKEFASLYYDDIAYVNFEALKYLRGLFATDFDTERIMEAISAATRKHIVPGKTLIFLDEIQEAENGITSLKYFNENAPSAACNSSRQPARSGVAPTIVVSCRQSPVSDVASYEFYRISRRIGRR